MAIPLAVAHRLGRTPISRMRRLCFAAFTLLVVQYGLGTGVNLFVTVPKSDTDIGKTIRNGPLVLSLHAVIGVLLVFTAIALIVLAARAGARLVLGGAVLGALAMAAAAAAGSAFVRTGANSASMAMGMAAGVGLLCYGMALFALGERAARPVE